MKLSFGWVFFAFLADLFSLFLLSDAIGAWWTLGWVLAAMALGMFIILDAGDTLRSLGGMFSTPAERVEAIKETPWMLLVGLLFFIPGVISDIFAVLLWLPVLRKQVLRPKVSGQQTSHARTESARTTSSAQQQETVIIEGEFIEKSTEHLPPHH
jgi:UPF0716 family protein affecting phage T7 exclusion